MTRRCHTAQTGRIRIRIRIGKAVVGVVMRTRGRSDLCQAVHAWVNPRVQRRRRLIAAAGGTVMYAIVVAMASTAAGASPGPSVRPPKDEPGSAFWAQQNRLSDAADRLQMLGNSDSNLAGIGLNRDNTAVVIWRKGGGRNLSVNYAQEAGVPVEYAEALLTARELAAVNDRLQPEIQRLAATGLNISLYGQDEGYGAPFKFRYDGRSPTEDERALLAEIVGAATVFEEGPPPSAVSGRLADDPPF